MSGSRDEGAPGPHDADAEEPIAPRPRKRGQSMGQSIGGVLFGFEQQVWRNVPPPHELVHHARPDDPVPAGDGGFMTLEIPEPLGPATSAPADAARPEPEIHDLAERVTVAMRIVEPMATVDVGAEVDRTLPAVRARIGAAGLAIGGPPYVRYHDWGNETADLEIGFPVAAPGATALATLAALPVAAAGGAPGRSSLPGGPSAVALHIGPRPDLPVTWGRLMTWTWDRDLASAGPTWESYVDDTDLVDAPVLRTEVFRPIRA